MASQSYIRRAPRLVRTACQSWFQQTPLLLPQHFSDPRPMACSQLLLPQDLSKPRPMASSQLLLPQDLSNPRPMLLPQDLSKPPPMASSLSSPIGHVQTEGASEVPARGDWAPCAVPTVPSQALRAHPPSSMLIHEAREHESMSAYNLRSKTDQCAVERRNHHHLH